MPVQGAAGALDGDVVPERPRGDAGTLPPSRADAPHPGTPAAGRGVAPGVAGRGLPGTGPPIPRGWGLSPRSRIGGPRSEEHTSELQSLTNLVCRLLLEKKNTVQEGRLVHDKRDID